jgi:hypothetical protein
LPVLKPVYRMLADSLWAAAERIRVEEKAPTRALPVYEVLCQAHGGEFSPRDHLAVLDSA